MAIFKFNNMKIKPSALKIWTTLVDTPIHAREGYAEDQIRYRMFICLQLGEFKSSLTLCNTIIKLTSYTLALLLERTCTLVGCKESDFDLSVASDSFPHWVSSELYVPYYLTKQLCHRINSTKLLMTLFDRTDIPTTEIIHYNIDGNVTGFLGLTAYSLYNNKDINLMDWITISYDKEPILVANQIDITSCIFSELLASIEVSDSFITPENAKTTIPYFKLKDIDASQ